MKDASGAIQARRNGLHFEPSAMVGAIEDPTNDLAPIQMHRVVKSVLLVAAVAISQSASATRCDEVEKEDQLEVCLADEFLLTDRALNAAYSKLRGSLSADGKALLTKAQRLWVSLRDADCEMEAESHKGGSGYQAVFIQCRIDKTKLRIQGFQESKFWPRS